MDENPKGNEPAQKAQVTADTPANNNKMLGLTILAALGYAIIVRNQLSHSKKSEANEHVRKAHMYQGWALGALIEKGDELVRLDLPVSADEQLALFEKALYHAKEAHRILPTMVSMYQVEALLRLQRKIEENAAKGDAPLAGRAPVDLG